MTTLPADLRAAIVASGYFPDFVAATLDQALAAEREALAGELHERHGVTAVLARPGMDEATLGLILARQMPDADKRRLADWVIPSGTLEGARAAIMDICAAIMAKRPHA